MVKWAKWPISTNFGNNWVCNTVSEIFRQVPLFVVLELTKLEYPLFFIHVAPDHHHMEFKKLIGTRAHEARVPFSHVSPQATLKLICYPNYQKRKEFDSTHLVSLSPSPLAEHVQTLTPSHHQRQRTLVGGRGYRGFTPSPSL